MPRGAFLLAVVMAAASILAPAPAAAQAIDWLASQSGIDLPADPGSSRLDGMGGLRIVVPDEARELNLHDYGRIASGLLWDGDYRRWDFWASDLSQVNDRTDDSGLRTRNRDDLLEIGGRMSWRPNDQRVLGGEYVFDQLEQSIERGDRTKSRGPRWGIFGAQRVGKLAIGGSVRLTSDNEDLSSDDVFSIRHRSDGARFVGSLAYRASSFELGLQAESQTNTITGISREEARFHEDEYTWKRPVQVYSGAFVWHATERLAGALRARGFTLDGSQKVAVSWSDRMPGNPGGGPEPGQGEALQLLTGTFSEEADGVEMGTRWELLLLDWMRVAVEAEQGEKSDEVVEGDNFKGSRRALSTEDSWTRAGGGAGAEWMDGRMRFGVEGWMLRNEHKQTSVIGAESETTSRILEMRTGLEFFIEQNLAIRAGYNRSAEDSDLDAPRTLGIGDGVTFGLGYYPRGGIYAIDAAVQHRMVEPDYEGDPASEGSSTVVTLAARLLL